MPSGGTGANTGGGAGAGTVGGAGGGSQGGGLGGSLGGSLGGDALPEEMRKVLSGVAPGRPIELPPGSGESEEELQVRCGEMRRDVARCSEMHVGRPA